jgi:hypothetical protein
MNPAAENNPPRSHSAGAPLRPSGAEPSMFRQARPRGAATTSSRRLNMPRAEIPLGAHLGICGFVFEG